MAHPKGAAPSIQPKLTVGPANDQYEQEADNVADQVVGGKHAYASQPAQVQTIQRQQGSYSTEIQREEKDESADVLTEGASIAFDNLKLAPGFDAWKKQQTELLKYKLWDSQPASYKAGLISYGAFALTGLGTAFAADPEFRAGSIDFLQDKSLLMPLSLIPYSEYFPVSSFKYKLPGAEGAPYTFKTEFEFDPWLDLMSEKWGTPKMGLGLGMGSSYSEAGGFSAVNSGSIKLTFGGGIVNLSGFLNGTLPITPMLISNPALGEQPMWLMRSLPDQLDANLPKGTGVFITIDVQRLPQLLGITKPDPKGTVQRKENSKSESSAVPEGVNNVLNTSGKPLDTASRDFMEPRFNRDFSDVRVHTDTQAAASAKSINAKAYTSGRDIVFDSGQCDPHSSQGKHLLAHELTHVVQQTGGSESIQRKGPEEDEAAKDAAKKAKIDKAKKAVVDRFSVSAVVDGDKNWTEAELITLKDALDMLPMSDKTTLQGIIIERVISLGGTTAGQFSYSVKSPTGTNTFTQEAKMQLADLTYSGSNTEAKRTIVHEVGHAVVGEKPYDAMIEHAQATVELNNKATATGSSFSRLEAANKILDPAVKALNDKIKEFNGESDPAKKTLIKKSIATLRKDYLTKKAASQTLLQENKKDVAAEKKARDVNTLKEKVKMALNISPSALGTIKKDAEAAVKNQQSTLATAKSNAESIDTSDSKVKTYNDTVLEVSDQLTTFFDSTKDQDKSEDDVELLIAAVDNSIGKRDSARGALKGVTKGTSILSNYSALEASQNQLFEKAKKHALAHNRNKKVHEFSTFVETNHIDPITPYAAENWPHKPEEFYAEAYSYWVTGKLKGKTGNLKSPYDQLQKWFDGGKYR